MTGHRIPYGTLAALQSDGEFGDGYWRIFSREPCWPPNDEDTWINNGGPAFDTQANAEKYLRGLQRA